MINNNQKLALVKIAKIQSIQMKKIKGAQIILTDHETKKIRETEKFNQIIRSFSPINNKVFHRMNSLE